MPKQLEFKKVNGWGGKRKNAGRKNRSGQEAHLKRETINFKKPLGITQIDPGVVEKFRNSQGIS